jgi:hypothetical protein
VLSYDSDWHKLVPVSGDPASRLEFNEYAESELGARGGGTIDSNRRGRL